MSKNYGLRVEKETEQGRDEIKARKDTSEMHRKLLITHSYTVGM